MISTNKEKGFEFFIRNTRLSISWSYKATDFKTIFLIALPNKYKGHVRA